MRRLSILLVSLCLVSSQQIKSETSANTVKPPTFPHFNCDSKGFIRDWLIGGPFPNYQLDGEQYGFRNDFLKNIGGEQHAEPHPGLTDIAVFKADKSKLIAGIGSTNEWGYKENKTFPVSWKKLHCNKTKAIIQLNKLFSPIEDYHVTYAFCYVYSPIKQQVKIRIGSDDDHKLWFNGQLIGQSNTSQGINPDNFIYNTILKPGLNKLMLKVVDRTHGHGFCLALSNLANKPLENIKIYLDDPKRNLLQTIKGLKKVDCWNNGFYAGFIFDKKHIFKGKNPLMIQLGVPETDMYTLNFKAYQGNKILVQQTKQVSLKSSSVFNWNMETDFPEGNIKLSLDFSGPQKMNLNKLITVYDLETLKKQRQKLKQKILQYTQAINKIEKQKQVNLSTIQQLKARKKSLYKEIERAYRQKRKENQSNIGVCDEPVILKQTDRIKLCLNGDQWQAAAGSKSPNSSQWQPIRLPMIQMNKYFRTKRFPVESIGKSRYGKVKSLKGWEDYTFNPVICSNRTWFKTPINLPKDISNKIYTLLFENVSGKLTVYLNGKICGNYFGNIGIINFPLTGAKPGENLIELYLESPDSQGIVNKKFTNTWGIKGDIYLIGSNKIKVSNIDIRTSWRRATISTQTELRNYSHKDTAVVLKQYCVLKNRIRYRLPEQTLSLKAQKSLKVNLKGIWDSAELWGIGGNYGDPVLYNMVTDLYVDNKLADRQITPFGFREFWIAGFDFFLNGKRIILQGDTGLKGLSSKKSCEVIFPLLRADGINIIRSHDGDYWSPEFLRSCDQLGMLTYAQMYPILHHSQESHKGKHYLPQKEWLNHSWHQYNLDNYKRWVKMLRNHPSVVIASTDNEIFTQAWDVPSKLDFNIRNDKLGAIYGKYVKSLNPALVMTRNGDEGTWGTMGKWQENPPCDTANYHYADFNLNNLIINWQQLYGFRPLILGETLYCSYGAWNNWIGPVPSQVAKKAQKVRHVGTFYRDWEVPAQIYMGLSHDGYVQFDNTGKGNPWGFTADMYDEYKKNKFLNKFPRYPWGKINWPSLSGPGLRPIAHKIDIKRYGSDALNWYDPKHSSHVRNKVNDAYRDSLIPQPSTAPAQGSECIIEAKSGQAIYAQPCDSIGNKQAVIADKNGKAWFWFPTAGKYKFSCDGINKEIELPKRKNYAHNPGFDNIPKYKLNK